MKTRFMRLQAIPFGRTRERGASLRYATENLRPAFATVSVGKILEREIISTTNWSDTRY